MLFTWVWAWNFCCMKNYFAFVALLLCEIYLFSFFRLSLQNKGINSTTDTSVQRKKQIFQCIRSSATKPLSLPWNCHPGVEDLGQDWLFEIFFHLHIQPRLCISPHSMGDARRELRGISSGVRPCSPSLPFPSRRRRRGCPGH